MSNELTLHRSPAAELAPRSADEAYSFAERALRSGLLSSEIRSPEAAFTVLVTGMELGLQPMQALRGIHVIKGKAVLSADLIVALVKRSEVCEYFRLVKTTAEFATYETKRKGEPEPTPYTFTREMAKRAGLTGGNHDRYPETMLRHRCAAALARMVYPDVVLGIYEESEGEEIRAAEARQPAPRVVSVSEPVRQEQAAPQVLEAEEAEIVPAEPSKRSELEAAMRTATSQPALDTVAGKIKAALASGEITAEDRAALSVVYGACKAALARVVEAAPQREVGEEG
jgi:hypothetical protein